MSFFWSTSAQLNEAKKVISYHLQHHPACMEAHAYSCTLTCVHLCTCSELSTNPWTPIFCLLLSYHKMSQFSTMPNDPTD